MGPNGEPDLDGDTVVILGAGFSYDAGIPLLSNFMDRMWEFALRGKIGNEALDPRDLEIFRKAVQVRLELNEYHGRAAFDDRNIEDVLSLLSFRATANKTGKNQQLDHFTSAIARTVELTCQVKHEGPAFARLLDKSNSPYPYKNMWEILFSAVQAGKKLPTFITFNYDLVLERSLLHVLIGRRFNRDHPFPTKTVRINYFHDSVPEQVFLVKQVDYTNVHQARSTPGTHLVRTQLDPKSPPLDVNLLKLHGSVNFHASGRPANESSFNFAAAVDSPLILPPIFNKQSGKSEAPVWRAALLSLQRAKHVIFVG